jgi:hypothetical protein
MAAPLPVGKVVLGAFLTPWWKRRAFLRSLAVPLAALAALTLAWYAMGEGLPVYAGWGVCLLYWLLVTSFAVRCHRLVLLERQPEAMEWKLEWSRRDTMFFLWSGAVWFIYGAVWLAGVTLSLNVAVNIWQAARGPGEVFEWLSLACKLPALYVFARLCLALPAIAVDGDPGLKSAWRLTRGNGWRLMIVVGVLPWAISEVVSLLYRGDATAIETGALTVLGIALFAVEIAALSISYRELTGGGEPQGAA